MAAKLRTTVRVKLTNAGEQSYGPSHDLQADLAADPPNTDVRVVLVPFATEADFVPANVAAEGGTLLITNLDAANFLTWGPKSGGVMVAACQLPPGDTHKVQISPGAVLRWQADTADVNVQIELIDK